MRRFWVGKDQIGNETVTFVEESFHHLVTVSRQSVGDRVEVLCGDGFAYEVQLSEVSKRAASGRIVDRRELPTLQRPYLNLAICMPKPANFEWILEKSVELGAHSIQPLFNENSFFKSAKDIKDNKWERWKKIIQSATEQSGRADLMTLHRPKGLKEFFPTMTNRKAGTLGLFLFEGEGVLDIRSSLQNHVRQNDQPFQNVWALIGSEGGFAPSEVQWLRENGLDPITVGPLILRVETACVAILSVIKYEFGLMA